MLLNLPTKIGATYLKTSTSTGCLFLLSGHGLTEEVIMAKAVDSPALTFSASSYLLGKDLLPRIWDSSVGTVHSNARQFPSHG